MRITVLLIKIISIGLLICVGALGGCILGFLIFTFGFYIGRSGYSGENHFGMIDLAFTWWAGRIFGGPLGAVVFPAGYLVFLKRTSFRYFRFIADAAGGTLLGGVLGSFGSPFFAAILGCVGFFTVCYYTRRYAKMRLD